MRFNRNEEIHGHASFEIPRIEDESIRGFANFIDILLMTNLTLQVILLMPDFSLDGTDSLPFSAATGHDRIFLPTEEEGDTCTPRDHFLRGIFRSQES